MSSSVVSRSVAKRCGSSRLVDDADRPAVGFEPDRAGGLAVNLHRSLITPPASEQRRCGLVACPDGAIAAICPADLREHFMAIDYEVEYNNRARVPEHPEIFARWARDGAAYRDEAGKEGRAEIGLKYGPSPRQTIDLFKPRGGDARPARAVHPRRLLALARTFELQPDGARHERARRHRRGRPATISPAGVDRRRSSSRRSSACLYLWQRFSKRIMVSGHSAGGHLAACMVATDWKKLDAGAPADLVPAGYAISGLYRSRRRCCISPPTPISSSTPPRRGASRRCSGRSRAGRVLDAVVGGAESSEFLRQSRIIADGWREKGVETRYEAVARHEPLHHLRSDDRSEQRDDEAAGRAGEAKPRTSTATRTPRSAPRRPPRSPPASPPAERGAPGARRKKRRPGSRPSSPASAASSPRRWR